MFQRPVGAALILLLAITSISFSQERAKAQGRATRTKEIADTKPALDPSFAAKPQFEDLASEEKPNQSPRFMRVLRNMEGTPIAFQTATIPYIYKTKAGDQWQVDVIGVVHIGEPGYYMGLNEQFEQYDSLCYELVAPPEKAIPDPDHRSDNPMAIVQQLMKSFLQLEHQLSVIDYRAENFVHADMSPKEMAQAQAARGDTQMTVMMRVLSDMMRQQNLAAQDARGAAPATMTIGDLFNPLKLKRIMAEQFDQVGSKGKGSGLGESLDQILIVNRNKTALKVVGKELNKGQKKVGLFYGAAHGPDFHHRLVKFGFEPGKPKWRTAWNLSEGSKMINDWRRYQEFKKAVEPIEKIKIK